MSHDPTIIGYRPVRVAGAAPIAVYHPVFQRASSISAVDVSTYRGRKDLFKADEDDLTLWADTALDRAQEELFEIPEGCFQAFIDELIGVLRACRED